MDTNRTSDGVVDCMTQEQRAAVTEHFRAIHEIMLSLNKVKMNWSPMTGRTRDGRKVTHKFTVGGYVREYPSGGTDE